MSATIGVGEIRLLTQKACLELQDDNRLVGAHFAQHVQSGATRLERSELR